MMKTDGRKRVGIPAEVPRTPTESRSGPPVLMVGLGLLCLALGAGPVRGEEAGDPPAEAEQTGSARSDDASTAPQPGAATGTAGEVFVPTEEISEDYAVSFPVDI